MMLIDGARAVVGSLALTALSLDFRREVALVVDEPAAVAELDQLFRSIGAAVSATDQRRRPPQEAPKCCLLCCSR